MKLSLQKKLFSASVLPLIIIFIGIVVLMQGFVKRSLRDNAISLANEIAATNELQIGNSIMQYVNGTKIIAHSAEELIRIGTSRDQLRDVMFNHVKSNQIFGGGILLEPNVVEQDADYAGDPDSLYYNEEGQFLPYINQETGTDSYIGSAFVTYKNESWYEPVLIMGETRVTEPFIFDFTNETVVDSASEEQFANGQMQMLVSVATPIKQDEKVVGVIELDITLRALGDLVAKIKPFGTGSAVLLSEKGVVIYSKRPNMINTSFTDAKYLDGVNPADITSALANNQSFAFYWTDADSGNDMYSIMRPVSIGTNRLGLIVTMDVNDAYGAVGLNKIQLLAYGMLSFVIIIIVISSLFIRFRIIRYVHEFTNAMVEVTDGDGDLTKTIDIKSGDEFEELANNLNKFLNTMREMITEIGVQADESAKSSQILSEAAENLHTEFEVQSREVESVASAVEEMSGSAKEVANTTDSSSIAVDGTRKEIATGQSSLQDAINAMSNITQKTESLAHTITTLSESSNKIGEILNVIHDIADQTNLLALNAAIEAARAGDAGRGFAVVADEVRKLAERTQRATNEIQEIIMSLQRDTGQASSEMAVAGESVAEGATKTGDVDAVFERIVESMVGIQANAGVISTAAGEQAIALQGLSQNARQISAGIDNSKNAILEFNKVTDMLVSTSSITSRLLSRFKVK